MLFFLLFVVLLVTIQLWLGAWWQPKWWLRQVGAVDSKTKLDTFAIIRFLAGWSWWSNPGWVVKISTLSTLEKKLYAGQIPLTKNQFLGFKQWLWSSLVLLGLLYLWFGEVTWARSVQGFGSGGLLFMLPDLWLQATLAKRARQIKAEVPPFLDLLTLTLQSGSNLEQALAYTCQNQHGVLSALLQRSLVELNWGRSLEAIFNDLKTIVPDPEFEHFLSSLLRAKKLGVSLGETLAIQSELLRTRRRQQAEELSRTAAVKISVPLVLFIFPALLIIYIGPGMLQLVQRA